MKLFYSREYSCCDVQFDTFRKSTWIAQSLANDPIDGVEIKRPHPIRKAQALSAHEQEYVDAVISGQPTWLAQSNGFTWDMLLWNAVCAHSGGMVSAALEALTSGVAGTLSSGFHHARHNRGAGFCTFNGLAIAAYAALDAGARSVLILDLDAHCGGGTDVIVCANRNVWQLDIATSKFDRHPNDDHSRLEIVTQAEQYLPVLRQCLSDLEDDAPQFDLCIYNAGMDPFEGCDCGGLDGVTEDVLREREQIVFDWCEQNMVPVAFTLAGGYVGKRCSRQQLVDLHRLTIETAAEKSVS